MATILADGGSHLACRVDAAYAQSRSRGSVADLRRSFHPSDLRSRTRLVFGTILATGQRTVAAALRAVGLRDERHFTTYHRVLNRAQWSPLRLSRTLLALIVRTLLAADTPIILLVDSTLVRRTGRRLVWKGRFHDAVRSQQRHIATSEGIHWLCLAVLVPVPWSHRPWALPFLSIPTLAPATSAKLGRRHRTTPEYADVLLRLVRRWQPGRRRRTAPRRPRCAGVRRGPTRDRR